MEYRAPKPTEYKGIVFRSKSEAIMFRAFELAGWHVDYEPSDCPRRDKSLWDYKLLKIVTVHHAGNFIDIAAEVYVEYKPSEPTQSYIDHLAANIVPAKMKTLFLVVWGNPFNPIAGLHARSWGSKEVEDGIRKQIALAVIDVIDFWPQAKAYRYDLK